MLEKPLQVVLGAAPSERRNDMHDLDHVVSSPAAARCERGGLEGHRDRRLIR
jgi:hypothetical protein